MTKSDVAINLKSKDYIESLKVDLSNFKNDIEKENIKNINNEYNKIKDIDISKFDSNTKEKIKELKKSVEAEINNKEFVQAKKNIDEINDIISKANKAKADEDKKDAKEQTKKEVIEKNNKNISSNDIAGTYTYKELNKYGVPIVYDEIKIEKIGENKISFGGGYNFLLHAFYNGKDVNAKDITKEIANGGGTSSKSGTRSGVLEYKGNNIWEGKVYDDNALTEDKGMPTNPKIVGKLSVNGDKLILTFEDKVVPYSKN